jgi:DNA-binding NarL/FixJ family response regulator
MQSPSSDILLLAKQPRAVHVLESLLRYSSYSIASAHSEEQALAQMNQQTPFLIILAGDHQNWSQALLQELRTFANTHRTTFVALTDFHAPRWMHQDENPGFDGFLVSPLSGEVLSSLVQSAQTRQAFCPAV